MQIGILEKLRSRAFAGTGRWIAVGMVGENIVEILFLSQGIPHLELLENPLLEGDGAVFPLFLEGYSRRIVGIE